VRRLLWAVLVSGPSCIPSFALAQDKRPIIPPTHVQAEKIKVNKSPTSSERPKGPPAGAPKGWFKARRVTQGQPVWEIHDWSLKRLVADRQALAGASAKRDKVQAALDACRDERLEDVGRMQRQEVGWPWYVHGSIWLGGLVASALVDRFIVDVPGIDGK